jgi:multidrug efflux pump subunit AcrB
MKLVEISIKKKSLTWFFMILMVVGGILGFGRLPKLEDPEFVIKEAKIFLSYPGASAKEMEDEVTYPVETALQELPYVDRITSMTGPGLTEITFRALSKYRKKDLPQIWDEVRKKINDTYPKLPMGVKPPIVSDDFGDVYGIFYGLKGSEYSYKELKDFADIVKREIFLVPGVKKVSIEGNQQEKIFVEVSQAKMKNLGVAPKHFQSILKAHNFVTPTGKFNLGDEYIRSEVTGAFNSVEDIGNLVVSSSAGRLIQLKDVATITRGYEPHPNNLLYVNSVPSLTIGLSIDSSVDIIKTEKLIQAEILKLKAVQPPGMELTSIYNQAKEVDKSVKFFGKNLIEAVAIVLTLLLIFMGWRSGLIIGSILLLIMAGTTLCMDLFGIAFHRISLGALIIALGMLVDDAIVVAEGMLVKISAGEDKVKSAIEVVDATQIPILVATLIAAIAFAPIGLSRDSTGEYAGDLFWVVLISLSISWVLAVTTTPLMASTLYKKEIKPTGKEFDPYGGRFFKVYRNALKYFLKRKFIVLISLLLILLSSIFVFKFVKKSFFPAMTTPMFFVDYYRQEGTDILAVKKDALNISKFIESQKGVKQVAITLGKGFSRFLLNYSPETPNTSYAQFLIRTNTTEDIQSISKNLKTYLEKNYAQAQTKIKRLDLGPSPKAKIVARVSGKDPEVLRSIADQIIKIYRQAPNATGIRTDWREKVKTLTFDYSQEKAKFSGVSRNDLNQALSINFSGEEVGLYREGINMVPIVLRAPELERSDGGTAGNIQIWSEATQEFVHMGQVVTSIKTDFENNLIGRRDRRKTIEVFADPETGFLADSIFKVVRPLVEKISFPPGYRLEWGGEYEESKKGTQAVFASVPMGALVMFILTIMLFLDLRHAIVIWACLPLAIIGVSYGLYITGNSFGFMCLLGILALSGMLIKNAIILIEEFEHQIKSGKDPFMAVLDSSLSRVRPVCLTAASTAVGMTPLLTDVFFKDMAITVIAGLFVATALTLFVVPIVYTMVFKIPYKDLEPNL